MKARYPTRCAGCATPIFRGQKVCRLYRNLWHQDCAIGYLRAKAQRTG